MDQKENIRPLNLSNIEVQLTKAGAVSMHIDPIIRGQPSPKDLIVVPPIQGLFSLIIDKSTLSAFLLKWPESTEERCYNYASENYNDPSFLTALFSAQDGVNEWYPFIRVGTVFTMQKIDPKTVLDSLKKIEEKSAESK